MITFRRSRSQMNNSGAVEYDFWIIQVGVLKIQVKLTAAQVNNLMRCLVTGQEFSAPVHAVWGGLIPVSRGRTSGTGKRMMLEVDHNFLGCEADVDIGVMQAQISEDEAKAETPK